MCTYNCKYCGKPVKAVIKKYHERCRVKRQYADKLLAEGKITKYSDNCCLGCCKPMPYTKDRYCDKCIEVYKSNLRQSRYRTVQGLKK